ncbi:hypothetical protein Ahy_A10g049656 [Arachis hypogaea]|uniref:Aspartic peptidase DDI1-type domain-containing protein n=1 Tax=Arachis hypogaea TaxID=3818 RepID=A0A445B7L6_ARAHY|nr:hypothetical protein Ahy_A10g049656 [Arachis hypogaea]
MEKGKVIEHSSGVNKGKEVDLDEEYFEEGDDEMVGTISIIPTEYLGEYEGDPEEDYDMEVEEAFSFIRYEDELGSFLRPTEKQKSHLRPLHITTTLSGIKVNKVLTDGGVKISLLPERMLLKVGKHPDYLVPTNIAVTDFSGCYLSLEGLTVKLRYPQLNFSHGLNCSSLCNTSDVASQIADLIVEKYPEESKLSSGHTGGHGTTGGADAAEEEERGRTELVPAGQCYIREAGGETSCSNDGGCAM